MVYKKILHPRSEPAGSLQMNNTEKESTTGVPVYFVFWVKS